MRQKKQLILGLTIGLVMATSLGLAKFTQISAAIAAGKKRGAPAVAITSYKVEKQSWPLSLSSIASLKAAQGTTLSAEVGGRIIKINFKSGQEVKAGEVLLELDTSAEEADLAGVRAEFKLAKLEAERQRLLRKKNATSQAELERAEAKLESANAAAKKILAVIAKKRITAPFSGKLGINKVELGQTISPGQEIVSITNLEELLLDFALPQRAHKDLRLGSRVEFEVDAYPGKVFSAKLSALESEVDKKTRSIWLQASLKNEKKMLLPGMFAKANLILKEKEEVLCIPLTSVSFAPYGNSVFKVLEGNKGQATRDIEQHTVQLSRKRGDLVAVTAGLKEGQEIASSAIFQLRPGAKVIVNNSVLPGAEVKPEVDNT